MTGSVQVSDAGSDDFTTRRGERHPKSTKGRNQAKAESAA